MALAAPAFADSAGDSPTFETNTYRAGHILARTDSTTPSACAAACSAAEGCHAWSFVGNVCELKPAMGIMAPSLGAESGLFFPGIGHLALRDIQMEPGSTVVPSSVPLRRSTTFSSMAEAVVEANSAPMPAAPTAPAATPSDPFAPRQVTSWSLPGRSISPASPAPVDETFTSDTELQPGAVEEDGVIYLDEDIVEEDFYAFPP